MVNGELQRGGVDLALGSPDGPRFSGTLTPLGARVDSPAALPGAPAPQPVARASGHGGVTREETPPTLRQFMRQRTRWDQGFLQVLMKGDWLRLPTLQQRLLAVYTLAFPTFQAFTFIYLPLSLWMVVDLDTPVPVAMVTALPLYAMLLQCVINVAGLFVPAPT